MEYSTQNRPLLSSLVAPTNIVVATDLGDLERLLPHAIAQAKSSGAHITLVHAIAIPDSVLLGEQTRGLGTEGESDALRVLTEMVLRVEHEGIKCSLTIKHGVAVDIVLHEIEATGTTRLIIGTHSHGYAGQQILGRVANALLRAVGIPVFVIGPHAPSAASHAVPHHILHPVSLTGQYRESANFAFELARTYGADLTLLHVLDSAVMRGSYVKEIFAKANQEIAELIATQHPSAAAHTVVECGDPVLEILRICAATKSDWIVMGIERDFPWWSMSDSAAYQVIAQAEYPVLTVHNQILF